MRDEFGKRFSVRSFLLPFLLPFLLLSFLKLNPHRLYKNLILRQALNIPFFLFFPSIQDLCMKTNICICLPHSKQYFISGNNISWIYGIKRDMNKRNMHWKNNEIWLVWEVEAQCFPGDSAVKNLPAMWETPVQSLGQENALEEGMATLSSILAWRIPWTEGPGWLQSMGSQRVSHDWRDWVPRHRSTVSPTGYWNHQQVHISLGHIFFLRDSRKTLVLLLFGF